MERAIALDGRLPAAEEPQPKAMSPSPAAYEVRYVSSPLEPRRAADVELGESEAVAYGDDGLVLATGRLSHESDYHAVTATFVAERVGWATAMRFRLGLREPVVVPMGTTPVNAGEWFRHTVSLRELVERERWQGARL